MKLLKTLKSLKDLKKSKLAKAVAMSLIVSGGVMGVSTSASAADDWYGFFNYKTGVPIPWTTNVKLARYSTSNDRVWDGLKYGLKYGIESANRVYDLYNMNNDGNDVCNSNVKIVSGNIDSVFGGYSRYTVARNNKTEITGGAINCVYGGCSKEKYAKQNKVVVNGAGAKVGVIYGGYSQEGYVSANRAEVLSGTVSNVYGGYSEKKYVINGHAYISGGEAGTVYGGYSKKGETEESSAFMTGGKAETIYGGYSVDYNSHQNEAIVASGATAKNIYGGYSVNGHAYHNTAHLSEIQGTADSVYGGYSEKGDAYNNIVKLVRSSVYDVYGGYSAGGIAYGNTVDLYDGFTVKGGIYGGEGQSGSLANILNVHTENASAPKIGYFQTINFYADVAKADSTMLTASDLSLCDIESFNTNIDVAKYYTPGKTITLLDTEDTAFIDKAKAAFKINGKKAEDVLINEKYSGIGVVAGYETTENAINFTTMYKLLNDVDIAKDMDLAAYGLKLNGKTVNMQSDPGTTPEYNTFTAKKITGTGALTIDADLANDKNDKIQISGTDANDATVTLNSIIVRKDLPGEDDQELLNKVSVIEGNLDGIAFKIGNGSISSSTSEYTYTFTKGTEAGKVNVTKEAADTIANFIQGKSKFKNLNSYTLTNKSTTADRALGITTRNEPCELNIAFNKDTSLFGKDNSREKYDGISVYYNYTLKLQGEDESAPGTMTKFNTAVRNHGILEVENMNFEGNGIDIDNRKTLNLNGTNTIGRIESEYGTTSLMSGKTTVGYLWQKELNVNAGELVLNGDAYAQTINISAGTVKGNITGRANNSTVTISDSTIEGDVYGGYASDTRETTNNVVNISGATVTGWVRGGSGFNDFTGNVLNVSGSESSAENIVHFAKINFTLSKDIKENGVMLKLTDTLYPSPLGDPEINTTVTNENYTPGTTVTLLSNDISRITRSNLKINDVEAEEATIATSMDGLSKNVNAIVGYDITKKAINFTTKSYELSEGATAVTKDVTLNRALNLNSATLNMQSDSDEKDSYKTLTVENLTGTGNLAIDVDMDTGESDKINITGDEKANTATINLNSIIVRKDLQEDPKEGVIGKADYVTVVDGKIGGTTLGLPNDSIKTATTKYVYTFTKGNDGKLNVDVERPGTFADFIPGTKGSVYENINTYTLTEDMAVEKDLGTTFRVGAENDKVITLAFNKGVSLSGLKVAESEESEESAKSVEGAIVKDTYTLKLQGEDAEAPGVMTQFKTAAVTNNGILEVENMRFEGNEKDIINNKALKLSGTNSINDITNDGTAKLEGKNTITTVKGTGSFDVEAGETVVSGEFEQNEVTVNGGILALNGDINTKYLAVAKGSLEIGGALNDVEALTNAGTVVMNSDNTLPNVMTILTSDKETTGSFNVAAGKNVTVEGSITQKDVNVNTNGKLLVKDNTTVTGTLKNAGTVSLSGSEKIAMLNNNGIAELNGTNKLETVVGTGAFNVKNGTTTVNGAFVQKELNVTGGELVLNAPKDSFLAGEVQDHAVNITDGKVTGHVYGGASVDNAHENNVNITNGTITNDVYGGISYNGDAYKNTVNISGGEVKGDVFGALTINNGTAYANTVNISDGTINGNVYGGINEYGTNSSHHDNVINISGGKVVGTIFGASDKVESNNLLKVTGSNIEVGNIAYVQKLDFTLPAGYKNENALLVLTNTADKENEAQKTSLDLNGQGSIVVRSASEERLEKGDVVTLIRKTNDQALEINDNGKFIFDDKGVLTKDYQKTAWYFVSPLNILKGNMQLVALDDDKIKNDLLFQVGNHILDGDEEKVQPIIPLPDEPTPIPDPTPQPKPEPKPIDPDKPIVPPEPVDPIGPDDKPQPQPKPITPVDPEPQPEPKPEVDPDPQPTPDPEPKPIDYDKVYGELMDNVKTALETRASGAALLNEAGDFLMKQGLSNAKMAAAQSKAEGDSSMAPFAVIGGGNMRYKTGSHVDSKSWHGAVGLAKEVKGLTFGIAIQQGKSNYDAYVNKAHSEGNSKSVGGALFAEKKTASGLHFDAAVRAGRVKNDYKAHIGYTGYGEYDVNYKESSAFYGISLGGGKEFNLKNQDRLDLYGRYAWTHTGKSDAITNYKDDLKFDGINSHRILLGGRYTHAVDDKNELYAGLGWQYELGGKVKGSVYGYSVPEPSLKGSSGLLELGWKAAVEENFAVDLNLSGWTGKQRGAMAGVNMQWKF